MNDVKEILMAEARQKGICLDGYRNMHGCNRMGLVDYYVANPDWCMERGFPSLETLLGEFSDMEDRGVFVGKTFDGEVLRERQTYIFHACKGVIRVGWDEENAVIPMLYFANGCDVLLIGDSRINAKPIRVPIYSFGGNAIEAISDAEVLFKIFDIDLR